VGGLAAVVHVLVCPVNTVTCICDLHLDFGCGPAGRLVAAVLQLAIDRWGETQKKGGKTSPCPLIHPASHDTALGIGLNARG
jgi:hypothetical protein